MMKWCLVLVLSSLGISLGAQNLVFLIPKHVRPGTIFHVDIHNHNAPWDVPLHCQLINIQHYLTIGSVLVDIRQGQANYVEFPIPKNTPEGTFKFMCRSRNADISMNPLFKDMSYARNVSLFLQTDKYMYKAGQKVKFRVIAMRPDMSMYSGKLDITIHDSLNHKIEQWRNEPVYTGVFSGSFQLSSSPLFGDWKLIASAENTDAAATINVKEYFLPKFEVKVEFPNHDYMLLSDTMLPVKVSARYTYDKQVRGNVTINAILKSWDSPSYYGRHLPIYESGPKQITNYTLFNIPMADIIRMSHSSHVPLSSDSLIIDAYVNEYGSGIIFNGSGEIRFYKNPMKIQVTPQEKYFHPGLPFNFWVKITKPNGAPLDTPIPHIKVTFSSDIDPDRSQMYSLSTSRDTLIQTLTSTRESYVGIKIQCASVVTNLDVYSFYSPSKTFMEILPLTQKYKPGDTVAARVVSTMYIRDFFYKVQVRGDVFLNGRIPAVNAKQRTFNISITPKMAPKAHLIVYQVLTSGEIVSDASVLNIAEDQQNKVSLQFEKREAKPGENVTLRLNGRPGSTVYYEAVDKSILLLPKGNRFTENQVISNLLQYEPDTSVFASSNQLIEESGFSIEHVSVDLVNQCLRNPCLPGYLCKDQLPGYECIPPTPSAFPNPSIWATTSPHPTTRTTPRPPTFSPSPGPLPTQTMTVTPSPAPGRPSPGPLPTQTMTATPSPATGQPTQVYPTVGPLPHPTAGPTVGPLPHPTAGHTTVSPPKQIQLMQRMRTRSYFPETLLWNNATIGDTGSTSITVSLGETVTTWMASAFSINPNFGLGFTSGYSKIATTLKFFVSMVTPARMVLGEMMILQPIVTNYYMQDQVVTLLVRSSNSPTPVIRGSLVQSGTNKAFIVPVRFDKLGRVKVTVSAHTFVPSISDEIMKEILIEPNGAPQHYNIPLIIDLNSVSTFSHDVVLDLPPSVVKDSASFKIKVTGELLAPSINGLETLLTIPTGCGEQTMIRMAPNVFISKYLEITAQMTDKLREKTLSLMNDGYQRELTYQHPDGSFSAWITDNSGSVWLTAFVIKSFHQARSSIPIDDDVFQKAIDWIIKHQRSDGSFFEPGRIIHKAMQGGSGSGVALSAFVTIALLENTDMKTKTILSIDDALQKALNYLESQIVHLSADTGYAMAITSYALSLARSRFKDTAFNKLKAISRTSGVVKFWTNARNSGPTNAPKWSASGRYTNPIDIETTAYALLAHTSRHELSDGLRIMKWIIQQRNPNGGFSSTQDTVIALQALSEFSAALHQSSGPTHPAGLSMNIWLTPSGSSKAFQLTSQNADVLQETELPQGSSNIHITADGHGIGLVEVGVFYHVGNDNGNPAFNLTASIIKESVVSITVRVCTRWRLDGGSSGMAVVEIGIPTGFHPDLDQIRSGLTIRNKEYINGKIVLYYDKITTYKTCIDITAQRAEMTIKTQKSPVTVFDYYNPANQKTTFYLSSVLQRASLCDVCPSCETCGILSVG